MKRRYLFILAVVALGSISTACDNEDDPKIEYTATYPVSGDWTVTYTADDSAGGQQVLAENLEVLIYNTAANTPDAIWVDDNGTFWEYKVQTPVNMTDLSFSGENLANQAYESLVTIANGKVFKDAATVNGLKRDSISFDVSFNDDETPFGTIYHVNGHRSTGFE
ncbi:lipid-binding protein [Pontibacter liquoris]|uniref:lipid-binding protein n=1 Tax=Pontibacter liquoris TaxID=2905677 RepID=UPI001FA811AA|nr:lipid-binding protein [Pontibacter liquoris]